MQAHALRAMPCTVVLSMRAINDLRKIVGHVRKSSPQNALEVAAQLQREIRSLDELPHRYKVHAYRNVAGKTVRLMPVPPFVVFYRIYESSKTVRILQVRHGRQRRPRQFP